ncbi:MAG: hypothetical protein IJ540_07930, partial [Prevotella sp.]|nr:hypothetical protein [Prevotella sp.]
TKSSCWGKRQSRAAQDFVMSDFSLTLVLQFKTSKIINDMAKVQIKSEKVTPFGGIFHVNHRDSTYSINTNIDFSNSCGSGRDIAAPSSTAPDHRWCACC